MATARRLCDELPPRDRLCHRLAARQHRAMVTRYRGDRTSDLLCQLRSWFLAQSQAAAQIGPATSMTAVAPGLTRPQRHVAAVPSATPVPIRCDPVRMHAGAATEHDGHDESAQQGPVLV